MDPILYYADEYVLDKVYPEALPRDDMFRQFGKPLPGAALAKLGVCRFVPPRGTEARRPPAGRPGSPMMCGGAAENCAHDGL